MRLAEATAQRGPLLVSRGWLDVPDVDWEPVAALPLLRRELLAYPARGAACAHRRAVERVHRVGRRVLRVRSRDAPAMIERARSRDDERR